MITDFDLYPSIRIGDKRVTMSIDDFKRLWNELQVREDSIDSLTTIYRTADRLPTQEDADSEGCVLAYFDGFWSMCEVDVFDEENTHWKRTGITQQSADAETSNRTVEDLLPTQWAGKPIECSGKQKEAEQ